MNIKTKKIIDLWVGAPLIIALKPIVYIVGKVLRRDHQLVKINDITIIKMQGGGSLVIALPALLGFRTPHP